MTDDTRLRRRRFLRGVGVAGVVLVAGCADSGDDTGDGSGGDMDGTDDGTDGDPNTTDDGTDSDDGTGEDVVDDPSETRLRDVFTWTDSYVMEFRTPDGSGTWTFNSGNWFMSWTFDNETGELYQIGSDTYIVADGQCFKQSVDIDQGDIFDPEEPGENDQEYFASGTTTIDGEQVYVFEIEDGTYYVSTSTGYPVRFEATEEDTVIDFHSWNDTDPISPPDLECLEF